MNTMQFTFFEKKSCGQNFMKAVAKIWKPFSWPRNKLKDILNFKSATRGPVTSKFRTDEHRRVNAAQLYFGPCGDRRTFNVLLLSIIRDMHIIHQ